LPPAAAKAQELLAAELHRLAGVVQRRLAEARGTLHVAVSDRVPLPEIARAHELVERAAAPGRVVLTID
jgi:hypothetical protein